MTSDAPLKRLQDRHMRPVIRLPGAICNADGTVLFTAGAVLSLSELCVTW